jgi:predicted DCC family thiol-disulfide oxidoreductase YuxK
MRQQLNVTKVVDLGLLVLAAAAVSLAALSYLRPRPQRAARPPVKATVGTRLAALDPAGALFTGSRDRRAASPVLVLAFRSTCPYCEANAANWVTLLRQVQRPIRVLAVSMEAAAEARMWLRKHSLAVDSLVTLATPADFAAWSFSAVPTTLVLDRTATVIYARAGVLDEEAIRSIVSLVSLPAR